MKPKTAEQKRVASLIAKSRPLGKRAMRRIIEGDITKENVKKCYFSQWERVEDYQVFRYFEVKRNLRTKKLMYVDEKFRNYFNCVTMEQTIVALQYNGLTSCRSSLPVFNSSSTLEVRPPHCQSGGWYIMDDYHDSRCYDTYVKSVHPMFAKRRITPSMTEEFGTYSFLYSVFKGAYRTQIETALIWGDEYMVWCLTHGNRFAVGIDTFWRSVLIARRHGFDFKEVDYKEYGDYLLQLRDLGYDLHSPKYLCPTDFQSEHERVGRLLQRKREKEMVERQRREAANAEQRYSEMYSRYFGIVIKTEGINILPLMSVKEFVEEGNAMHHCVYSCGYYKKEDTLILSAKNTDGERVETIEYNIKEKRVYQSRGVCNKPTPQHEQIVREVEAQMPKWLKIIKREGRARVKQATVA